MFKPWRNRFISFKSCYYSFKSSGLTLIHTVTFWSVYFGWRRLCSSVLENSGNTCPERPRARPKPRCVAMAAAKRTCFIHEREGQESDWPMTKGYSGGTAEGQRKQLLRETVQRPESLRQTKTRHKGLTHTVKGLLWNISMHNIDSVVNLSITVKFQIISHNTNCNER